MTQAVIYDPAHNDLFTATRGHGAYLNDRRIRVSKRLTLQQSLLATAFPLRETQHIDTYVAMLRSLTAKTSGVRSAGASSLDLAYVAAGQLDALWEFALEPWNIAAGSLLITEAGGLVGDFQGNTGYLESGNIVAGNPKVFSHLILALAPHLTPALKGKL
jgi:myo-inositol-1(or 4)-monophosphatase